MNVRRHEESLGMPESEYLSANGKTVRISVERKSESDVFGRDFVSGGLRDISANRRKDTGLSASATSTHPTYQN